MDGISAAASIISIATAGAQISIKLITLAEQVRTASNRVNAVANDVALTSAVLQQLGDFMNPEPDDGISVFNDSGLQTTANSARMCERIFEDLHREIRKASLQVSHVSNNSPGEKIKLSRLEKAKWPFLQPSMDSLRTDLREAKGTLTLILQVASLAYAKKVASSNSNTSRLINADNQENLIRVIQTLTAQGYTIYQPSRLGISTFPREEYPSRRSSDHRGSQDSKASEINAFPVLSKPTKSRSSQLVSKTNLEIADSNESANDVPNSESAPDASRNVQPIESRAIPPEMPTQKGKQIQDYNPQDKTPESEFNGVSSVGPRSIELTPSEDGSVEEAVGRSLRQRSTLSSNESNDTLSSGSLSTSGEAKNFNGSPQRPRSTGRDSVRRKPLERQIFGGSGPSRAGSSWNPLRILSKRQSNSLKFNPENHYLQVHFQKPSVCDFQDGVLLTWSTHFQQASAQEDLQNLVQKHRKSWLPVTQELANLPPGESQRVFKFLRGLPHEAELVSMRKTISDVEYKGMKICKVPSFCFVVSVKHDIQPWSSFFKQTRRASGAPPQSKIRTGLPVAAAGLGRAAITRLTAHPDEEIEGLEQDPRIKKERLEAKRREAALRYKSTTSARKCFCNEDCHCYRSAGRAAPQSHVSLTTSNVPQHHLGENLIEEVQSSQGTSDPPPRHHNLARRVAFIGAHLDDVESRRPRAMVDTDWRGDSPRERILTDEEIIVMNDSNSLDDSEFADDFLLEWKSTATEPHPTPSEPSNDIVEQLLARFTTAYEGQNEEHIHG